MPPKKRARGLPPTQEGVQSMAASQPVAASSRTSAYTNPNTTALAALPVELLLLILSFLPGIPVPCELKDIDNPGTACRSKALVALSTSCRWIRATVQPLVWRTLDVCAVSADELRRRHALKPLKKDSQTYKKALATQLLSKIEIVTIREPIYASRVQ